MNTITMPPHGQSVDNDYTSDNRMSRKGRKPIGERTMTPVERKQRQRQRQKEERENQANGNPSISNALSPLSCLYVDSSLQNASRNSHTTEWNAPVSQKLCNCGDRFGCKQCRSTWINRLTRSNAPWLLDALHPYGMSWHLMITVSTSVETWRRDADTMITNWQRLCKERLQQKFRGKGPLMPIRRGVGCIHLARGTEVSPHIHATLVTDPIAEYEPVRNRIKSFGFGIVDMEPTWKSIPHSVCYSINGEMPIAKERMQEIKELFHRKHPVRRIGT